MSTLQYYKRRKIRLLEEKTARSFFYFKEKQYLCGPKWTITPNIVYQTSKKNNNNKIIYRNEKRYSS